MPRPFSRSRPRTGLATLFSFALLALVPAAASAATVFVDQNAPGGANCGTAQNPCTEIQEGIDTAVAGDTVQVAAGIYQEQVDIGKALTLRGAGPGQTTILSPTSGALVAAPTTTRYPVVFAHGGNAVNISDLKVDGDAQSPCGINQHGILYINTGGAVDNIFVTHVRAEPLNGCQGGQAIYSTSNDSGTRSWTVSDSRVEDFQKNGITANEVGTGAVNATISDNTVTGAGPQNIAQNGIQLFGSTGTVDGNTVSDITCDRAITPDCAVNGTVAVGILLFDTPNGLSILDNEVSTSDVGIYETGGGTATISDNRVIDNIFQGIYTDTADSTISGNEVSGGEVGVQASAYVSPPASTPTVDLTGNTITDTTDQGVLVTNETASDPAPVITIGFNRIVDNATGIENGTNTTLNAENNWWGCNAGPNTANCDTTTGAVDSNPWLVLGLSANPTSIATGGATSQVTASLRGNSNGQTAGNSFPDGTPVAVTTTLGSIGNPANTAAGQAVSTLTSGATAGTATIGASLDNQSLATSVAFTQPATAPGPTTPTPTTPTEPTTPTLPGPTTPAACSNPITGKSKSETLTGTVNGDLIKGKAGNDKINGLAGQDCLSGGAGNDRIKARDGELDQINCGSGVDRVKADALDQIKGNCEKVKVKA